jgi:hypothetical protein
MAMSATPYPNARYTEASRHGIGTRVQKCRSTFFATLSERRDPNQRCPWIRFCTSNTSHQESIFATTEVALQSHDAASGEKNRAYRGA